MIDTRDLRDPEELGLLLLEQAPIVRASYGDTIPLSEIYDFHVAHFPVSEYKSDF